MGFMAWHEGRILKAYPGVIYEVSLVGGCGYCVLLRKDRRFGALLMIIPGVHGSRPGVPEVLFRDMAEGGKAYPLMFFPVSEGVRRGMLRSVGIVREVGSWWVPDLVENEDESRSPWLWREGLGWEFMPVDVARREVYGVMSVGLLRLLKGLELVEEDKVKKKKKRRGRKEVGKVE